MNTLDALAALRAMTVLEDLSSQAVTRAQLDALGVRDALLWEKLAATYYGATRYKKLQQAARVAAAELSLDAVIVIEKHLRSLLRGASVSVEELRVQLCGLRGTVAEIDRAAATKVRDLNRTVKDAAAKAYGKRALRGGKNTDGHGMRTFTVTRPEREISAMLSHLTPTASALRAADKGLSHEQAMADALYSHIMGSTGEAANQPLAPHVVMALPDYATVLRREGDDTVFGLTDGTTITGAELVAHEMATHGFVGIYDPVEGPVDLYRDQRSATFKQRMLLAAETILCPVPGCTTAADFCQVHHLEAWKEGGETNIKNMSMACKVHNARNDDDPDAPPRHGRLERHPGGVLHHPPDGGPPRANIHPIRKLSAMGLLNNA
ncbi:HNH endonuclease signature motif containing protein [Corynebacterium nasicanis]|uniref:HNH endonuclease signature motif containing protein n=1 Tax=Corynebacterium nasicanis TaxID=1448267 RepID=A0ABW1QCV1_9CORY